MFRNKALPQASGRFKASSFEPLKPCRNLSTDSPPPPWAGSVHSHPLCLSCPCAPSGAASSALGDLPGVCSACLPAHTPGFSSHRNQSAKEATKLQFSLESTFLSQPSHSASPMPSPAHLKLALTVLPLYHTWLPKHLVQTIASQAVWKTSRKRNF